MASRILSTRRTDAGPESPEPSDPDQFVATARALTRTIVYVLAVGIVLGFVTLAGALWLGDALAGHLG